MGLIFLPDQTEIRNQILKHISSQSLYIWPVNLYVHLVHLVHNIFHVRDWGGILNTFDVVHRKGG